MGIRLYSALRKLKGQEIALLQEDARLQLTSPGEPLRDPTHPTRKRIRGLDERILQLLRKQRDLRQQLVSNRSFRDKHLAVLGTYVLHGKLQARQV